MVLSLLLFVAPVLAPNAQADTEQSEKDLKHVRSALKKAERTLAKYNQQQNQTSRQLRQTETAIGKLKPKIRASQKALKDQQKASLRLKQQVRKLSLKQQQQETLIAEHLVAAYQLGREKKLKLLLNQEKADKLSRMMLYYDYVNKARQQEIDQYQNTLKELAESETKLEQSKIAIREQQAKLLQQKQDLQQQLKQRQQTLSKIRGQIKNQNSDIKRLKHEQAQLEALILSVEEALAHIKIPTSQQPFSSQKGKLPWPSPAPWQYLFGQSRGAGKPAWQGMTLAAREGSSVRAIHNGRVVFADWFNGKGLLLILDHGEGYMSLYAHNQSLLVEVGEWVSSGEQIATVGSSGGFLQPGLYFEVRKQGRPVNPKHWCRKRRR